MKISVVIPVRNGQTTLRHCLESLVGQTLLPFEIVIADTTSIDESRKIAKEFGARIIEISEGAFNHGLTRNEAIQHCGGDLIYLTVQDARISEPNILERMARHFKDPAVMAVCGHQAVPHEMDKNPTRWYCRYSECRVERRHLKDPNKLDEMTQQNQQELLAWDNVVAMYRRTALTELPFVQTEMAEDWIWSYQALKKGWVLLRDSSLIVYHYHHWSPGYAFKTAYSVHYHFLKFLGYRPQLPRILLPVLKSSYHLLRNRKLKIKGKVYWVIHNILWKVSDWYAALNFLLRLKMHGHSGIEKGYKRYCGIIPQGKQKQRTS